jgi:tRNA(His) guanylyltransferase
MIDHLGDRMKEFYESRYKQILPRRTNTILRLDGKGFSKFTRGLDKPYDNFFVDTMNKVALKLCKEIQGAKLAFVQSDEITVWLTDYETNETHAWFDNNLQKIISISASIATMEFNKHSWAYGITKDAYFDSRVFQISTFQEVQNCFLWRQMDCTRNSISSVAQALYSTSELHGKTTDMMQEMIFQKRDKLREMLLKNGSMPIEALESPTFNWNDLPAGLKRGRIIIQEDKVIQNTRNPELSPSIRRKWGVKDAPIFSKEPDFIKNIFNEYLNHKAAK